MLLRYIYNHLLFVIIIFSNKNYYYIKGKKVETEGVMGKIKTTALTVLTCLFLLSGCGYNNPLGGKTGSIGVSVSWPQDRQKLSVKVIPESTVKINVVIGGEGLKSDILQSINYPEKKLLIKEMPIGKKTVSAQALNKDGRILAKADSETVVEKDKKATVILDLVETSNSDQPKIDLIVEQPKVLPSISVVIEATPTVITPPTSPPTAPPTITPPTSPPSTILIITPPPSPPTALPTITPPPPIITMLPGSLSLAQNNSASLRVMVRDSKGAFITSDDVKIESLDPSIAKIMSISKTSMDFSLDILGASSGPTTKIKVTYKGIAKDIDVSVIPQPSVFQPTPFPPFSVLFATLRDGNTEIYRMNPDGSNPINVTNNSAGEINPDVSPNGMKILFDSTRVGHTEIYLMDRDGTNQTRLTNDGTYNSTNAKWSPDGTKITFISKRVGGNPNIYVMNADGSNQIQLTNTGTASSPLWAPGGNKIAFVDNNNLYTMDPVDSNSDGIADNMSLNLGQGKNIKWSPDGSKIAFGTNRDGNWEVYVMNPDGTIPTNLTNSGAIIDDYPSWSPDGTKIAFLRGLAGATNIWIMDSNGSNLAQLTTDSQCNENIAWMANGKILFDSFSSGNLEIWTMDQTGANKVKLTNNPTVDQMPYWAKNY